uniref:Gypsy retrotransposon integrase-like protein 1 n=1 Tax=Leptobrachium leishanense TaxID=445787 RepID=A0A8C5R326_9ANUR
MGAPPNKPPDMLFVPEKERQELLIMFHDSNPAGHPGITKTLTSISRQFWNSSGQFWTAKELAVIFAREIVRIHGVPSEIVSDRGAQFVSRFWRDFCAEMGVRLAFSSAYHPQTNGAAERANQSLEQYISCFTTQQQDNWSELLPWAEYARNNAVNETTGHSPFSAIYGFSPPVLPLQFAEQAILALDEHLTQLQDIWRQIRENMERNVAVQKRMADRHRLQAPSYNVGDRVWLSTRNVKLRVPAMKMAPRFISPYKIIRRVNPVAYALALPRHLRLHNVFHTSLLKPLLCNRYTRAVPPPPPVQVDGETEYEVRKVLDSRLFRGALQYLVNWVGYGPEDRSWIPASNMSASRLVRAFHASHPIALVVVLPLAPVAFCHLSCWLSGGLPWRGGYCNLGASSLSGVLDGSMSDAARSPTPSLN